MATELHTNILKDRLLNIKEQIDGNYYLCLYHKDIPFYILETHFKIKKWDWNVLSKNTTLTIDILLRHLDKKWDWYAVSKHKNITLEMIESHPELPWDYYGVGNNPNVPLSYILNHLDKRWMWIDICRKKHDLCLADVVAHPEAPWNFRGLSEHPAISLEDIVAHPELPWNWKEITKQSRVKRGFVFAHPELPWDWEAITRKHWVMFQDLLDHPEWPWDWNAMGGNPNITLWDMLAHPELPWRIYQMNWRAFSMTDGLSYDLIVRHLDLPWDWDMLIQSPLLTTIHSTDADFIQAATRHLAACRIQRRWRRAVASPDYVVCRRRLMQEFDAMTKAETMTQP